MLKEEDTVFRVSRDLERHVVLTTIFAVYSQGIYAWDNMVELQSE